MKKTFLLTLSLISLIQSIQAGELNNEIESTEPTIQEMPTPTTSRQMLNWFKSLRKPTWQDVERAKQYLNAKWECLRYGTDCTKRERAVLAALSAAVAAAVIIYAERKLEEYKRRREIEDIERTKAEVEATIPLGTPPAIVEAMKDREILRELIQKIRDEGVMEGSFLAGAYGGIIENWKGQLSTNPGIAQKIQTGCKKQVHYGFGCFSALLASPRIETDKKRSGIVFLKEIGLTPTPNDLLQMRLFDWEQAQIPEQKLIEFQKLAPDPTSYVYFLPEDIRVRALSPFVLPQPILQTSPEIKAALNRRAELRKMMEGLRLFIAKHPSIEEVARWYDDHFVVHSPITEIRQKDKNDLVYLVSFAYLNTLEMAKRDPTFYRERVVTLFPNIVRLEIKNPDPSQPGYSFKEVIWASPNTTRLQKDAVGGLSLGPGVPVNNSLQRLYQWEQAQTSSPQ